MKRKRGNKKGKSKKTPLVGGNDVVSNADNPNTEDNSALDDYDKDESDSEMETETPSSTGTDQQVKVVSTNSSGVDKTKPPERLVYGRVKVKIKTSKILESQLTSSDLPTQSDTDKSGQQVGLEKQVVREKVEDSANSSLPGISVDVPANQSKKAGSIKIKPSKGFSSSSLSPCNNVEKEVSLERSVDEKKRGADSVREHSPVSDTKPSGQVKDLSRRVPQQNKQELNTALEVIKKIMKMDAAEPFNVPVNPIALGIPDYFDVIDTPMDFGTICSNIENGLKYMNADDVLKDVQFIWGNCYKYNNKGDYILELMKRVKKNFAKYWSAAGFSNEQMQDNNGGENSQSKDLPSGKMKGGNSKHKSRKRQKVKRHKDDCLCAICVMMRRRQEREESMQIDEDHKDTSDSRMTQEVKPEDNSPVESLGGEGTSSSMDNSADQDGGADVEDKGDEVKKEDTEQQQHIYSPVKEKQAEEGTVNEVVQEDGEISEQSQLAERTEDEQNRAHHIQTAELGSDTQNETQKGEISMQQQQHVDESATVENHNPKESLDKTQKARICENLRRFENPMLLELCGTLFSDNPKSLWSGPHSLIHRQGPARSSPIHAAVATFMK